MTRKLYRDGTSEYFLNKTPCRLRDITEFFLGTGDPNNMPVARADHQAFILNNELCILAGSVSGVGQNDTWCSPDGSSWRLAYSVPMQFP